MQPPQAQAHAQAHAHAQTQDPDRPTPYDTTLCVEELRDALAAHGITLPSLRVDLSSFAAAYRLPAGLIALGNCNTATARKLAEVVRKAAGR